MSQTDNLLRDWLRSIPEVAVHFYTLLKICFNFSYFSGQYPYSLLSSFMCVLFLPVVFAPELFISLNCSCTSPVFTLFCIYRHTLPLQRHVSACSIFCLNLYFATLAQPSSINHLLIDRLQSLYIILVTFLFFCPNLKESFLNVGELSSVHKRFYYYLKLFSLIHCSQDQSCLFLAVFHQRLSVLVLTCLTGLNLASSVATGTQCSLKAEKANSKSWGNI